MSLRRLLATADPGRGLRTGACPTAFRGGRYRCHGSVTILSS